jgi:hypothetical protein
VLGADPQGDLRAKEPASSPEEIIGRGRSSDERSNGDVVELLVLAPDLLGAEHVESEVPEPRRSSGWVRSTRGVAPEGHGSHGGDGGPREVRYRNGELIEEEGLLRRGYGRIEVPDVTSLRAWVEKNSKLSRLK